MNKCNSRPSNTCLKFFKPVIVNTDVSPSPLTEYVASTRVAPTFVNPSIFLQLLWRLLHQRLLAHFSIWKDLLHPSVWPIRNRSLQERWGSFLFLQPWKIQSRRCKFSSGANNTLVKSDFGLVNYVFIFHVGPGALLHVGEDLRAS